MTADRDPDCGLPKRRPVGLCRDTTCGALSGFQHLNDPVQMVRHDLKRAAVCVLHNFKGQIHPAGQPLYTLLSMTEAAGKKMAG